MTDDVWSQVPDGTEMATAEEFDLGRWEPPPDTVRSGHEHSLAAAREEAQAFFVSEQLLGPWAVRPDVAAWPEPYRLEFEQELKRLEDERASQSAAAVELAAKRAEGGPS